MHQGSHCPPKSSQKWENVLPKKMGGHLGGRLGGHLGGLGGHFRIFVCWPRLLIYMIRNELPGYCNHLLCT